MIALVAPLLLLGFLVVGLIGGLVYHRFASWRERRLYPPTGELVAIDGTRLHVVSAGRGTPTVVLDSALAGSSLSWSEIQPRLAELTRVVSYDRAGFGWSDASPAPRTVDNMVEELDQLLANADVEAPYVLVGHSYGGWIVELYASRHRNNVAGLVLVDAPHPREWMDPDRLQTKRVARGARLARRVAWCARFGLMRLMFLLERVGVGGFSEHGSVAELLGKTPVAIRSQLRAFWVQPSTLEALASQIENAPASATEVFAKVFDETSHYGDYGDMPLVVLTAANPDAQRLEDQLQTTALSRAGRHVVARRSGHWIPLEEPDLIVDAVRDVVSSLR